MAQSIIELNRSLEELVIESEKRLVKAHEQAMKELAYAKLKEDKRQEASRELQRVAQEKLASKKAEAQEAEASRIRQEEVACRLAEQEENRKQAEAERLRAFQDDIMSRILEMEHAEELAKKALRDALQQAAPKVDTERVVPNPLERFFQPQQ